ncbi:methylmalonyl-CoA mutase family protein [Planococcus shenhongbingii]|uniref:Methylmalonyl-CoA mutase family protein n=1 Tax=Planococcus shenhongbingii TaxID=3058398 RepID=A0ABT8NCU6_9BACL|nr:MULTISPECIES: methylmalonyl-CoA mutase family protein [unclassified Planococcus (in: firmicutes)]MDN7245715.1 methylmalonyl-CoA mutase family protein [Planococcus sp. N017]WKA60170.1 methylmalonyl-CoA mutase family protein [Planococcus sp. N016]
MTIESMKQTNFSERTYEDWREAAEKTLKGKPFEKTLKTPTIEGLTLEPLYTKEMLERLDSFVRSQTIAVQNGKRLPGWFVAQETHAETAAGYLDAMKKDLKRGNEMVVYTSNQNLSWSDEELKSLAELIVHYPLYFRLSSDDNGILRVFDFIEEEQLAHVQGVIYSEAPAAAPQNVRTQLVDTIPVHNAGGTIVHELGVALSILAETFSKHEFQTKAADIWVRFAVDTQFFQEIAKLRAFRVLWNAFCSAYGETAPILPVFTETSVRSYSKLDPYVNLLRAGNATFSAVLGGTNAHTVHPHDFLTVPDEQSSRIARNVQLVIKEETHVSHVLDAAAGSYFIETLTKEFVDAAWSYFLEIEEAGGYSEVIKSGWLTDDIQAKWVERKEKVAAREHSLIGTNIYANPQEPIKEGKVDDSHLVYMTAKRLAAPFEKLRAQSKLKTLKTAVLHLGPLKTVKSQSDFVQGFLAVGGIEPLLSPALNSAQDVNQYLADNAIDYAVLCGPKEKLDEVVPGLETAAVLDVAGKYSKDDLSGWAANGVADAIFAGKHIISKLEQILSLGKEAI